MPNVRGVTNDIQVADISSLGARSNDTVTWFEQETPAALLEIVQPDVLVKGGDWPVERIVGGKEILARGGRVVSIPFRHERSTSALVQRIRKG